MTASLNCTGTEQEEIACALDLLHRTVIENPFIPVEPTEPQGVFLTVPALEVMYGGAGGGGKSIALLAAALQYVQTPGYSALLLRRTFPDLNLPDGLIPLSHEWLNGTPAQWSEKYHHWTFPSGATLTFGYLENERDKFRYKGPSFQFIGFDELTGFTEPQYRFLFQRLRKRLGLKVPLRMRSATNPGDIGHEWVKTRFIDSNAPDRDFIPARLEDNPHIDAEGYELSLSQLDPVTRQQFRHGDWSIRPEGNLFKREWIEIVDDVPPLVRIARGWDFAATAPKAGTDPDYTAGVKIGLDEAGCFYVLDVVRQRVTPHERALIVRQTAMADGPDVAIRIEQEPGSSGVDVIDKYVREVLPEFNCRGEHTTGKDKVVRAQNFSAAAGNRRVKIVSGGSWIGHYLDELCAFPVVGHDDQVDASVNAHKALYNMAQLESEFFMASSG
jgi:predicted phage terminase large subunit-like protein